MSVTIYGYGICTDEIKNATVEGLKTLICMAPNVKEDLMPYFEDVLEDCGNDAQAVATDLADDWNEHTACGSAGLATILAAVIAEEKGIRFEGVCDDCCNNFLIFPERHPWEYNEKERVLTEEDINDLIREYVCVLTNEVLVIKHHSVYFN